MSKMQLTRAVLALLAASVVLAGSDPRSREVTVAPSLTGEPVIGPAVRAASPGSVIRLRKGVYREVVSITKPVSLAGDEGAILDPSEAFRPKWEPAVSFGTGVYKAVSARVPASLIIDGKLLAQLNLDRPETQQEGGRWNWKTLLATGAPRTGFRYIRGVWLYSPEEKAILVHLENDAEPSRHNWSVIWTTEPVITLANTEDASVRGLTVAYGYVGIAITANCLRCSVTHCKIGPWDKVGVLIKGGASESLVEDNEIFRGAYEDWTPVAVAQPGRGLSVDRDWYEVWQIHKEAGFWDRVGVALVRGGVNSRIHANHVHDTFDGIDVGDMSMAEQDAPVIDPRNEQGAEVWENVIERTADSGMEVGGPAVNVRIHHNTFRRTHGGLRYKSPLLGPVFIYRNVLIDGSPYDIWYSMGYSPAEGYVYHNTVVGGRVGLAYNPLPRHNDAGAPRWHYVNNLVSAGLGFFENRDRTAPANFIADYNVTVGGGKPYPKDADKDVHSRYVDDLKLAPGFPPKPLPGSPAIDAGLDLSTYYHGKPLPGCEPGYFKGKAPDAGAYEVQ